MNWSMVVSGCWNLGIMLGFRFMHRVLSMSWMCGLEGEVGDSLGYWDYLGFFVK